MSRTLIFTVPASYAGQRLCAFLCGEAQISYAMEKTLRHTDGAVLRNGMPVRSIDRVEENDRISVTFPQEDTKLLPAPIPLQILYEDSDLLVLNKCGYVAMHPSHGHQTDSLANGVTQYLAAEQKDGVFHAVGRLDKGTSGVVVCALHAYAASCMATQTKKTYYAVVDAELEGCGTIDKPIIRPDMGKTLRAIGEGGERAVTHYEVLASGGGKSLVCLRPETGRTHQIRVHMASIGAPLTGDSLYGTAVPTLGRHLLHCATVELRHPVLRQTMIFSAPFPQEFLSVTTAAMPDSSPLLQAKSDIFD